MSNVVATALLLSGTFALADNDRELQERIERLTPRERFVLKAAVQGQLRAGAAPHEAAAEVAAAGVPAAIVEKAFVREGVKLVMECEIERVERKGDEKVVHLACPEGTTDQIVVDEILVGVGRAPNVEGMGLEAIDLGPLAHARWIEGMLIVWINNRYSDRESFDFHLRPTDP